MAAEVIGFCGKTCPTRLRKIWNLLLAKEGREAVFEIYPTGSFLELQLRFSEMFFLDRKGYVMGEWSEGDLASLIDFSSSSLDSGAAVDTVANNGGVLTGFHFGSAGNAKTIELQYDSFFGKELTQDSIDWLASECRKTF